MALCHEHLRIQTPELERQLAPLFLLPSHPIPSLPLFLSPLKTGLFPPFPSPFTPSPYK